MAGLVALSTNTPLPQLIAAFNRLLARLNAPIVQATYTTATRPSAAANTGALIYVSDAAAGNKLQYSDGAAWVVAG